MFRRSPREAVHSQLPIVRFEGLETIRGKRKASNRSAFRQFLNVHHSLLFCSKRTVLKALYAGFPFTVCFSPTIPRSCRLRCELAHRGEQFWSSHARRSAAPTRW